MQSNEVDYEGLRLFAVPDLLAHAANLAPERLAVVDNIRRMTYRELWAEVQAFAAGLQALGVGKGDRVGVCLPNWHEFLVTYFAIGLLGAVLIPLNTRYKPPEVEYILANAGASTVITAQSFGGTELLDMYLGVKRAQTHLHNVIVVRPKDDPPLGVFFYEGVIDSGIQSVFNQPDIRAGEDLFAILYTSGTTGTPKGAMLTHRNLVETAVMTAKLMECTPKDVFLVAVPMFHVFGMGPTILSATACRGSQVCIEVFKPEAAFELIQQEGVTVHHGVPTMFVLELNHVNFAGYNLSSLRTGIIAGAPCPVEVVKGIRERMGCNICVAYGLTETSPTLTITRFDDDDSLRAETVGRAMPGVEIKIVDLEHRELAVKQIGEVACHSYGVTKGYYGKPAETAEVLTADGWFYTGDLGELDDRGFLRIVGRKKEMLIRGGYNIYPAEVENVLYTHPAVMEVAVIGIPDRVLGERSCACIQLKSGTKTDSEEIRAYCKERLADYKVPDLVEFVNEFPITASGKIRKVSLKETMTQHFGSSK